MLKPLKVGLIGAGGIAGGHRDVFLAHSDQARLVAICDINEDAARKLAQTTDAHVFVDADAMLKTADIDAVDICTIHDQHAPLAIAAAEAGKHILLEKPMACSMQECQDIVRAAENAGVTLMIAQHQRYMPSYAAVRRLIREGELGAIRAIRFDSMQNLPASLPVGHWYYDGKRAGGGVVISLAVHRIDLARYFVGEVKRVHAICRTINPQFVNGAEDFAVATFEFQNGAIGEMFATLAGVKMPWAEQFMIFGDDGMVHAVPPDGSYNGPALIASRKRGNAPNDWQNHYGGFLPVEPDRTEFPTDDGYANEILHFAECCRTGREPISSGRDNLETMKIVFAIYESARLNHAVEL